MKGGLANTPFSIVFLQLREILGSYVVSDVDAGALHDVQGELYGRYGFCGHRGLGVLEMHEDLVLLARCELDAEDFHCLYRSFFLWMKPIDGFVGSGGGASRPFTC